MLCLISCISINAQKDSISNLKNTISGYPVAFFSPETSWGFGGFAIYAFRFKGDTLPSQISLGGAYTLRKQVLAYVPFQIYLNNRSYIFKGELGYYKYFYNFFGVGNNNPTDFEEIYRVDYPRIRLTGLYQVKKNTFAGLSYAFDSFKIVERDTLGILIKDSLTGSGGGRISGIGPSFLFDNRDNIFFPRKGYLIDINSNFHSQVLGAEFNYGKITIDIATYLEDKWKNVWAFNAYTGFNTGNAPFFDLLEHGGGKKGRGYFQGRYRDNTIGLVQAEYRFKVYKRFSATAFGTYGGVSNNYNNYQFKDLRYTVGGGIRFLLNKQEHINIRLDAGFGKNTSGFYLTIGEAF